MRGAASRVREMEDLTPLKSGAVRVDPMLDAGAVVPEGRKLLLDVFEEATLELATAVPPNDDIY